MKLLLGTLVVDFRSLDRELDFALHGTEAFISSRAADVTVGVRVQSAPPETWIESTAVDYTVDAPNGVIRLRRGGWSAVFDLEGRHVEAVLSWPAPSLFDLLVREVVAVFAAHEQVGLVLHASSVATKGQAVLFLGRSEAGKSTAAELAAGVGCVFLADDMIFVEVGEEEPRVHCLPVAQKNGGVLPPHAVPLRSLYALWQSEADAVEPLDRAGCLKEIVKATVLTVRHPILSGPCLALADRLAGRVTCGQLHFRKTPAFWNVVRADLSRLASPAVQPGRKSAPASALPSCAPNSG